MDQPLIRPSTSTSIHVNSDSDSRKSTKSLIPRIRRSASFTDNDLTSSYSSGYSTSNRLENNSSISADVSPMSPLSQNWSSMSMSNDSYSFTASPLTPARSTNSCNDEDEEDDSDVNTYTSLPVSTNTSLYLSSANSKFNTLSGSSSASSSKLDSLSQHHHRALPMLPSWDPASDWILQFDQMLKLRGRSTTRQCNCICRRKSLLPRPDKGIYIIIFNMI